MNIDLNKSLAELTGIDWGEAPIAAGTLVKERHTWHRMPVGLLPDCALGRFLDSGIDADFVVPLAIQRLEGDRKKFGLLIALLGELEFQWLNNPDQVRRLRNCVGKSLSELGEWDGSPEVGLEALQWGSAITRKWALFELNLSQVKD